MKEVKGLVRVVGGLRYSVATATLVASDRNWGLGRTFLYRTRKGRYFTVERCPWRRGEDRLTPVSEWEAKEMFEHYLLEHEVEYEVAFPGAEGEIDDA